MVCANWGFLLRFFSITMLVIQKYIFIMHVYFWSISLYISIMQLYCSAIMMPVIVQCMP